MGRLMVLLKASGYGKSFVIDAILTILENEHGWTSRNSVVAATTGTAAKNVCGGTIHSFTEGLGLPCGRNLV